MRMKCLIPSRVYISAWGALRIKNPPSWKQAHCASRCLSLETKVFGLSLFFLFKLPSTYFALRMVLQSKGIYFPSGGKLYPSE